MLSSRKFAGCALCIGLWSGCAADSSGLALGEANQSAQVVSTSASPAHVIAAEAKLGASSWEAVAGRSVVPGLRLEDVEWDEDDAKLLLAMVLKGACRLASGCDSWLPTALDVDAKSGVTLSAAAYDRLAGLAKQLRNAGNKGRAQAIEEWLVSAEADLESVSSIGLSQSAVNAVLSGLLGRSLSTQLDPALATLARASTPVLRTTTAVAASAAAPGLTLPSPNVPAAAVSGLAAPADAYLLDLYAKVRGITVTQATASCPVQGATGLVGGNKGTSGSTGTATCAPGGGDLDSALDTSCENLGPNKQYCLNEEGHEWGTEDQIPHIMGAAFAASARRCEPCQDGAYAFGTLRLIVNSKKQRMTMCDTSDACDPTGDPTVPSCTCL